MKARLTRWLTLVAAVLAIGILNRTAWADDKPDAAKLAGTWKITVTTDDGQTYHPTLKIKHEGGQLAGTFVSDSGQEVKVTELKLDGGKLTFKCTHDLGGQPINLKFEATVAADALDGKVDYELGGDTGTVKLNAKRAVEAVKLAGTWKITAKTDDGQTYHPTLKLEQHSDQITGTYITDDGQQVKVQDAKLDGGKLTFKVTHDFGGQPINLKFEGTVASDALNGKVDYEVGGDTGTVKFDAKRDEAKPEGAAKPAAPAPKPAPETALVGSWQLKLTAPDGNSYEPSLKLTRQGDIVVAIYIGTDKSENEVKELTLKDGAISFRVTRQLGGQDLVLRFHGKLETGTVKGKVDFEFSGQSGTGDFEGKLEKAPAKKN